MIKLTMLTDVGAKYREIDFRADFRAEAIRNFIAQGLIGLHNISRAEICLVC